MTGRRWLWVAAIVGGTMTAVADPLILRHTHRPVQETGVVIVPDGHLRRWDPVTLFYPQDVSRGAGPEDHPERYLDAYPDHPGSFEWLDARTLQFRPAAPWPPLSRMLWRSRGEEARINTVMSPPVASIPEDGADSLAPIQQITLSFVDALDPAALQEMVEISLQPMPGVGSGGARTLGADDFSIKSLQQSHPDEPMRYVLLLKEEIPLGTQATVRLRLAVDSDGVEGLTASTIRFSTAAPFQVVSMGCAAQRLPLAREGVQYTAAQQLDCGEGATRVVVEFSAPPQGLGVDAVRNLVRFSPSVDNLSVSLNGRRLEVGGDFAREQTYRMRLMPSALVEDVHGRALQNTGEGVVFFGFSALQAVVGPVAGDGIMERFGPHRFPLSGQGASAVDIRIHRIDPLDLRLWPFSPSRPVVIDENVRPPGPGEEDILPDGDDQMPVSYEELAGQITQLGSPLISEVVALPLSRDGAAATFGVDLAPYLETISGSAAPGTYLVGVRDLGAGSQRSWSRVQVTDLSLTAVEVNDEAHLVVTSLSSGLPIVGAEVHIEGVVRTNEYSRWETIDRGQTDRAGVFVWEAPGTERTGRHAVRRIRVTKGDDVLVLDPLQPPRRYSRGGWQDSYRTWLQWGVEALDARVEPPKIMCHLFAERPVIRPEQPVHLKGYARRETAGQLSVVTGDVWLNIEGPGFEEEIPLSLTEMGSIYHRFDKEEDFPSGYYTVEMSMDGEVCGHTDFTIDAYRIPRFEVLLSGDSTVPMDRAFPVELDARYYAGGDLGGRPVRWRVSQHFERWTPPTDRYPGFLFSSDARFSRRDSPLEAPRLETVTQTDAQGHAQLMLDPTAELSARPRTYFVEATVTGDDDETVTTTRQISALPPFVLGLKTPRLLTSSRRISPEIVALDPSGTPLAGEELTVRLFQRQWHSHLQAGDFTDGEARYVTDTVDVLITQQTLTSQAQSQRLSFDVPESGVYIVEVSGTDQMGRAIRVRADLFASGDAPISWAAPESGVFTVVSDAAEYNPGQVASLIIESPFQQAQALVIVEAPDGPQLKWVSVQGGQGIARVVVGETWVPQVPVHVILMRGRLSDDVVVAGEDLGKPTTLAASTQVSVTDRRRRLQVSLDHPEQAQPGARVPMTIRLTNHRGLPSAGEVTLWLVDAAVLALGRETPLDPVPSFLRLRRARAIIRDTRDRAFGWLPYQENPGGDGDDEVEEGDLFARATVRRNFSPVPYYNPTIAVPASGRITVPIDLADSLTTFKVRAKAVSRDSRAGFATSRIDVRLPVIVQPSLPRFVRPGDQFEAAATGRLVEGEDGAVTVAIQADGLQIEGPTQQDATLSTEQGTRLVFPATVPRQDVPAQIGITVAMERSRDQVGDAFAVQIPVRPDRQQQTVVSQQVLQPGTPVILPAAPEGARDAERVILATRQPALLAAAQATAALQRPRGGTVQRLSAARAWVGLGQLRERLGLTLPGAEDAAISAVRWMQQVVDDQGLIAGWPGASGSVSLTAWALQLDVELRAAGHPTDPALTARMVSALQRSLRSDAPQLVDGAAWLERVRALSALSAAGHADDGYLAEAARASTMLGAESLAEVLLAAARNGETNTATTRALVETLVSRAQFRLQDGAEAVVGLEEMLSVRPSRVLSSEARSLAEMIRALLRQQPDHPRLPVLIDALVARGSARGWGDPSADASALLALQEWSTAPQPSAGGNLTVDTQQRQETLSLQARVVHTTIAHGQAVTLGLVDTAEPTTVAARLSYVPAQPGSTVSAAAEGFVVHRTVTVLAADGAVAGRHELVEGGGTLAVDRGTVVEEHIQVVVPADRDHVEVVVPLAAGMEALNPQLATASPLARPRRESTASADYVDWRDDQVVFAFDTLPAGTWDLVFRARATTPGQFTQPPARAAARFAPDVWGHSAGVTVVVE